MSGERTIALVRLMPNSRAVGDDVDDIVCYLQIVGWISFCGEFVCSQPTFEVGAVTCSERSVTEMVWYFVTPLNQTRCILLA